MLLLRLAFKKITASTLGAHFFQIILPGELPGELLSALESLTWVLCLASHQGGKEVLSPQIREDLRLANNLMSELRSTDISFPRWTFSWHCNHRRKLDSNLIRDLESESPSSATLGFLTLKSWEIIQVCYFKMLSVGVICYAAKYNSLRPQGCSLLAKLERGWNKVSRRKHGRWWCQRADGEARSLESHEQQ